MQHTKEGLAAQLLTLAAYITGFHFHDLRHTFALWCMMNGGLQELYFEEFNSSSISTLAAVIKVVTLQNRGSQSNRSSKIVKLWNEAELQRYINDEIEESLTLDYKASGSLDKADVKKKEITKDVSAMMNAAGGFLIFGMSEFPAPKNHLPERLDPIDRTKFTKEWLEHVISNIRPRPNGIIIHSVGLTSGPDAVVYVVEIPKGETAHQALDHRYYKRFNFESVPMADHEIRDVMQREVRTPALQGLQSELEFNAKVGSHYSGGQVGCNFLDEQFRRVIHLGILSGLPAELKDKINKAYMSIGKANHVLHAWAAASGVNGRINMQQEVIGTIRATGPDIEAAISELKSFNQQSV